MKLQCLQSVDLRKTPQKYMHMLSFIINDALANQATYSRADLFHGKYVHMSFMLQQCQTPAQRLTFKTLQY